MRYPDGIGESNIKARRGLHPHASVLSLAVLGLLLAVGLSGYLGDDREHFAIDSAAGRFAVDFPTRVRNGNIIETLVDVKSERPIAKLVIAVEPGLWRNVTTNSTEPAAASETFEDGLLRFTFDKLDAGESFHFQIAQQINPSLMGANRGRIVFLDGSQRLAEIPLVMTVLP